MPSVSSPQEIPSQSNQPADKLKSGHADIWNILAETGRKLQRSSTSVKVAVSSLLDSEIFWDAANQREFLTTINTSIDQVFLLSVLLALAFRSEAGRMELLSEPLSLQELLVEAIGKASEQCPSLKLNIKLPDEDPAVLGDYEYLSLAFGLLFDVLCFKHSQDQMNILVVERANTTTIEFNGLESRLVEVIEKMPGQSLFDVSSSDYLPQEYLLKIYLIRHILQLQKIQVLQEILPDDKSVLRLQFAVVEEPKAKL